MEPQSKQIGSYALAMMVCLKREGIIRGKDYTRDQLLQMSGLPAFARMAALQQAVALRWLFERREGRDHYVRLTERGYFVSRTEGGT